MKLLAASAGGQWRSSLNNDGSPLQVSVSFPGHGERSAVRLIADPAAEMAEGQSRWHRAARTLSAVLASHAPDLKSLCHPVIDHVLPAEPTVRAALPSGGVWLAADLSGKGLALYATVKWADGSVRWKRTRRWLQEVLHPSAATDKMLDRLASRAVLVSVGVEGVTPKDARAKLYWRLDRTAALHDLGVSLFSNAAMSEFLSEVIETRRVSKGGIVGSIGFRVADGCISDVKLDVCCHCVCRTSTDWMQLTRRAIARHQLTEIPVVCPTLWRAAELAFVGFGLDTKGTPRLNLYLKRSRASSV